MATIYVCDECGNTHDDSREMIEYAFYEIKSADGEQYHSRNVNLFCSDACLYEFLDGVKND